MELKENTRTGWQDIYTCIRNEKGHHNSLTVEANVKTLMQDMLGLRYFFAVAKRLEQDQIISKMHPLVLNIRAENTAQNKTSGSKPWNYADGQRLKSFICDWQDIEYIQISWNNITFSSRNWNYSSIFPCCTVNSWSGEKAGYELLNQEFYDLSTGYNVGKNHFVEYANALLSHLLDPDYYIGIVGNSLNQKEKNAIVEKLNHHLKLHLGEMTILSQIIWTFFLCGYLEEKSLFWKKKTQKGVDEVGIAEKLLAKSRLDAITYASGMYNAIENACLYSEAKQAWFGFRVHRASRSATPSDHLKEAQTREMLYYKYADCIADKQSKNSRGIFGNNNYRYYFEFYVLDNAFTERGILYTYNDRVFDRRKERANQYALVQLNAAKNEVEKESIQEKIRKFPKTRAEEPTAKDWNKLLLDAGATGPSMIYLSKLEDIFYIQPRETPIEARIEDITEHFGLRMLKNIVQVSGGYLRGCTPDIKYETGETIVQRYPDLFSKPANNPEQKDNNQDSDQGNCLENKEVTCFTEWNVIVPVTDEWESVKAETKSHQIGESYFGEAIQAPPTSLVYMNETAIFTYDKDGNKQFEKDKKESVKVIEQRISNALSLSKEDNGFSLLKINTVKPDEIELLCKALFALVARRTYLKQATRLALLMKNMDAILEVVRFFTAFYCNSGNISMENVQIALCTRSQLYDDTLTVDFLLMGSEKHRALDSARQYVYYHSEDIAEHIPLLKHLSALLEPDKNNTRESGQENNPKKNAPGKSSAESVFPFDLFLPQTLPLSDNSKEPIVLKLKVGTDESWFIHRTSNILNTDLRKKEFGCRIDDIHIRIGSKVHLNRFFEADLLFQNAGNVSRFAYLIAQDLLYGNGILNDGQSVLLLGYEKYSASLLLQIEYWLKESQRFPSVYTAIVYDHETRDEVKLAPYFNLENSRTSGDSLSVQSVVILPIATTLSTVYKVFNTAKRKLPSFFSDNQIDEPRVKQHKLTADKYYSIVLVNSDLLEDTEDGSDITKRYWKSIYRPDHEVLILPEKKRMKNTPCVRFFIPADGKWNDPTHCPICRANGKYLKPIIDTQRINSKPKTILTLYGNQFQKHSFKASRDNKGNDRVCKLYGNILYSHLSEGRNHFQFYLDYHSIYEENHADIDSQLRDIEIEREAFHVVVSPIQIRNSLFVRSVLNNAFEGRARMIYFDPTNTYREDFRSRFSQIAEDFKLLKRGNSHARIHFHFVDCSIVTGTTINRARALLQMLLTQAGIDASYIVLFEHIFLLVNRSNYDTINCYVQDPDKDLTAYIQFNIPSYNTHRDYCPACGLHDKYELMEKCSSTLELRKEFKELIAKHKKRTKEEYEQWQEKCIFDRHSYLSWLFLWLYVFVPEDDQNGKLLTPISENELEAKECKRAILYESAKTLRAYLLHQKLSSEMLPIGQDDEQWIVNYHKVMSRLRIKDLVPEEPKNYRKIVYRLFRDELIPIRNYMRISALHNMYSKLDDIAISQDDIRHGELRNMILEVISDKIGTIEKDSRSNSPSRYTIACKAEWLISYIKVLSREQFSNYYDYRQAIAGILSDILTLMNQCAAQKEQKRSSKKNKTDAYRNIGTNLDGENTKWKNITRFIREIIAAQAEPLLCALYFYQIYMTVFHRLSDLQIISVTDAERVNQMLTMYSIVSHVQDEQLEVLRPMLKNNTPGHEPTFSQIPLIEIPDYERMLLRYLKAVKVATMSSGDATPCIMLANTFRELISKNYSNYEIATRERFSKCMRYLYLENTQMMYEGMRNLNSLIQTPEFLATESQYPPAYRYQEKIKEKLGKRVREILLDCYSNVDVVSRKEDILHQNIMADFCEFWHRSTGETTVGANEDSEVHLQITHMLQYYRLLEKLDSSMPEIHADALPYYYEELCRAICGITSFKMCYIVYSCDGEYPSIIAQSGYYSKYSDDEGILTSSTAEQIIRLCLSNTRKAEDKSPNNGTSPVYFHENTIEGVSVLVKYPVLDGSPKQKPINCKSFTFEDDLPEEKTEYDYIVLSLPIESGKNFHIILQSNSKEESLKQESDNPNENWISVLRKARDILFMRRSLFEALKRDYTTLINLRFDCSYIRPAMDQIKPGYGVGLKSKNYRPSILHVSDLHITGTEGNNIFQITEKTIQDTLKSADCIPDLLVVSGDLVDSRDSDAKIAQMRYKQAEKLLRCVARSMWEDQEGYLPHDWRRRIIISTGNHDYASMNQYQPKMKHRALIAAMPAGGESGTMAKFAYYIDFLIQFLDVPADELLRNDLNEIREYRNLNLKCLVLNMSSAAVTLRSNKLGVDRDVLRRILLRKMWSDDEEVSFSGHKIYKICVGHYSPLYEPNYGLDAYGTPPGWEWDDERKKVCQINQLVIRFWAATMEEISIRIRQTNTPHPRTTKKDIDLTESTDRQIKTEKAENLLKPETAGDATQSDNICCFLYGIEQLDKAMNCLEKNGDKELLSDCAKKFYTELDNAKKNYVSAQSLCNAMREADLYKIMDLYRRWIKKGRPATDEEVAELLRNVTEAQIMAKRDSDELFYITKAITEAGNIDVFFAGHIHEFWEWHKKSSSISCHDSESQTESRELEGIENILVSNKFYDNKQEHVYGYLIKAMNCDRPQKIGTDERGKPLTISSGSSLS